jgi:predicted Zn-dependent protease
MLQSALRLGPDHPELLAVLDGYFFDHRQGLAGLEHFLNATRPTSEDRYLESLKWMKKMIQNEPGNKAEFDAQKGSMRGWETQSTVGLMAYWIGATRRYRLEWNRIEPILNAMTEAQPSSGDLKLGRAILAAESGQLDRAIEELEIIRESNSNNPFVENLMRKVTQRIKEQRESDESMKEAVR